MRKPKLKSRTYEIPHHANDSKLDKVREILPLWQSCLVAVQLIQTRKLKEGKPLGWLTAEELNGFNLPLSARQLKSVTNQVNGALRSWQALTILNVRAMIREGDYDDSERRELYRINVMKDWWSDTRTTDMVEKSLREAPFPNLGTVRTMLFDTPVCAVEDAGDTVFDAWLKVSTLDKGRPVLLPVSRGGFYGSREGEEAGVTQAHVRRDGSVVFSRVKQSPLAPIRTEGETLGLDWGLASLFTASDGRRLGSRLYSWLAARDAELTKLTAALQRQGIKQRDSKRLRAMNNRIREYVRNEVNRVLNLLSTEDVRELVVEKLDFRHGGLSRTMNRILSRAGRGAVKTKLAAITEDYGITVTEVNPAYTSQECDGCGFTDRYNRRFQSRFCCRFCGKKLHADIKASRTILSRRSVRGDGFVRCSKRDVLTYLDEEFQRRWGIPAAEIRERQIRGRSTATLACSAA